MGLVRGRRRGDDRHALAAEGPPTPRFLRGGGRARRGDHGRDRTPLGSAARRAGRSRPSPRSTTSIERLGTTTGVPFGRYRYSGALRPTVAGVPALVPLAWFAMALPARETAHAALGRHSSPVARVLAGSAALTAWDLFLDPQMVAEGYWRWERPGRYRGIPVTNYLGWLATGIGLMALLEVIAPLPARATATRPWSGCTAGWRVMETVGFAAFFDDRAGGRGGRRGHGAAGRAGGWRIWREAAGAWLRWWSSAAGSADWRRRSGSGRRGTGYSSSSAGRRSGASWTSTCGTASRFDTGPSLLTLPHVLRRPVPPRRHDAGRGGGPDPPRSPASATGGPTASTFDTHDGPAATADAVEALLARRRRGLPALRLARRADLGGERADVLRRRDDRGARPRPPAALAPRPDRHRPAALPGPGGPPGLHRPSAGAVGGPVRDLLRLLAVPGSGRAGLHPRHRGPLRGLVPARAGWARSRDALVRVAERVGVDAGRPRSRSWPWTTEGARVGGVRTADGQRHRADVVVANVDAEHLYRDLLPDPRALRRASRAEPSMSGFVVLAGVRGRTPGIAHHMVWFSADQAREFRQLTDDRTFPADPTIYACVSSVTDPTQAPPGHENWFLLVNAPHPPRSIDDAAYRDLLLERLAGRGMDLRVSPVLHRDHHARPTWRARYRAPGGSIYGTSSNGRRAAFLRPGQPRAAARAVPGRRLQPSGGWAAARGDERPHRGRPGPGGRLVSSARGAGPVPRSGWSLAGGPRRRRAPGRRPPRRARHDAAHPSSCCRRPTPTRCGRNDLDLRRHPGPRRGAPHRPAAGGAAAGPDGERGDRGGRRVDRRHGRGWPDAWAPTSCPGCPSRTAGWASPGRSIRASGRATRRLGGDHGRRRRAGAGAARPAWCVGPRPTGWTS